MTPRPGPLPRGAGPWPRLWPWPLVVYNVGTSHTQHRWHRHVTPTNDIGMSHFDGTYYTLRGIHYTIREDPLHDPRRSTTRSEKIHNTLEARNC